MVVLAILVAMTISADVDSVRTVKVQLPAAKTPSNDPYGYYMTLGPVGAADSVIVPYPGRVLTEPVYHRLRVTLRSCEGSISLAIDDIEVGRADTRTVTATYFLSRNDIRQALGRPVLRWLRGGPDTAQHVIEWLTPTTFELSTSDDTLVVEHVRDAEFQLAVRPRLK